MFVTLRFLKIWLCGTIGPKVVWFAMFHIFFGIFLAQLPTPQYRRYFLKGRGLTSPPVSTSTPWRYCSFHDYWKVILSSSSSSTSIYVGHLFSINRWSTYILNVLRFNFKAAKHGHDYHFNFSRENKGF